MAILVRNLLATKFAKPAVFGLAIALFVGVAIVPAFFSMAESEREIEQVEFELERQQKLFPIFVKLLKASREKSPELLPLPETTKLSRGNTDQATVMLRELAADSNLKVENIVPDMQTILKGSKFLKVRAVFSGDMDDFRDLLVKLGGVPYLQHTDNFKLQTMEASHQLRFGLTLWLNQE